VTAIHEPASEIELRGRRREERASDAELAELLDFHKEMVHRAAAYVHSLRMHLRDQDGVHELVRLLPEQEIEELRREGNRPIAILHTLGERFRDAWLRGWVHSQHLPVLEKSLGDLTDIQGGCERIKSTPIPFSYTALIHRIVAIYCFALPFGIVNEIEGFTPVVVAIISYAFFGLDAVGDEIEDPFGTEPNDLPLTMLSTMIEIDVRRRIDDEDLPAMPVPIKDVLI
jgi:ion channel-forming bestrophin family protein